MSGEVKVIEVTGSADNLQKKVYAFLKPKYETGRWVKVTSTSQVVTGGRGKQKTYTLVPSYHRI